MFVLMALLAHIVVESAVQLFFANHSGIWRYLSDYRENAKKDGMTLDQYAVKIGLDGYHGWGKSEARIYEPSGSQGKATLPRGSVGG